MNTIVDFEKLGLNLDWLREYLSKAQVKKKFHLNILATNKCEEAIANAKDRLVKLEARRAILLEDRKTLETASELPFGDHDLVLLDIRMLAKTPAAP